MMMKERSTSDEDCDVIRRIYIDDYVKCAKARENDFDRHGTMYSPSSRHDYSDHDATMKTMPLPTTTALAHETLQATLQTAKATTTTTKRIAIRRRRAMSHDGSSIDKDPLEAREKEESWKDCHCHSLCPYPHRLLPLYYAVAVASVQQERVQATNIAGRRHLNMDIWDIFIHENAHVDTKCE